MNKPVFFDFKTSPVVKFHIKIFWSIEPLKSISSLFNLSIDHNIGLVWPVRVLIRVPFVIFQSLIVLSSDALAVAAMNSK